jgi:hypothetical protein
MQNGVNATVCWSCDAELPSPNPLTFDEGGGRAAGAHEDRVDYPADQVDLAHKLSSNSLDHDHGSVSAPRIEEEAPVRPVDREIADVDEVHVIRNLDDPAATPAADGNFTSERLALFAGPELRDVTVVGHGAHAAALADSHLPSDANANPDTESRFPILTQELGAAETMAWTSTIEAAAKRRKAKAVAAVVAVVLLVGAGAYLIVPTRAGFDARTPWDPATGAAADKVPAPGVPGQADPTVSGSSPPPLDGVARSGGGQPWAGPVPALAAKPDASNVVGARPPVTSSAEKLAVIATRSKGAPLVRPAMSSNTQQEKVRTPQQAATATAAVPAPGRVETTRQAPDQFGPCTATVAALGLCTAPPKQSKE